MPNLGEGTLYSGGQTGEVTNQYALAAKMQQEQVEAIPEWRKKQLEVMRMNPERGLGDDLMQYRFQGPNMQGYVNRPDFNPLTPQSAQYTAQTAAPGTHRQTFGANDFGSLQYNPFQSFESGLNRIAGQFNLNTQASRIGQSGDILGSEFAPSVNVRRWSLPGETPDVYGKGGLGQQISQWGPETPWAKANKELYQNAYKYLLEKYKPTFGSEGSYIYGARG